MAARRIGALRTVAIGEAVALAGYWILFMTGHFSLHGAGSVAWLLVLASPRSRRHPRRHCSHWRRHPGYQRRRYHRQRRPR